MRFATTLAQALQHPQTVTELEITDSAFSAEAYSLPALTRLVIHHADLTELPAGISALQQLEELELVCPRLQTLPDEIGALAQLEELSIEGCAIQHIPLTFSHLQKLKRLNIRHNPLRELPLHLLHLPHLFNFKCQGVGFPAYFEENAWDYYHILNEQSYSSDCYEPFYYIFCKDAERIAAIPDAILLQALRSQEKPICDTVLAEIARRGALALKQQPPQAGDELAVMGKIALNKNEMKAKLKERGIRYSLQLTAQTRYLVVGDKGDFSTRIEQPNLTLLTDRNLDQFFAQSEDRFLQQSDNPAQSDQIAYLSSLLLSRQDANIALALQIIQTGGLPQPLITDLFLVYKDPEIADKLRRDAQKRLELNASQAVVTHLKDARKLYLPAGSEEETLTETIHAWTKGWQTELDGIRIARHCIRYTGKGYHYLLHHLPAAERRQELDRLLQQPDFILHLGDYPSDAQAEVWQHPDLRRLSLKAMKLRSLPPALFACSSLDYLDLSFNSLKKFPEDCKKLLHLQRINLSYIKNLNALPSVFIEMPSLQEIIAEGCLFVWDETARTIWEPHFRLATAFPRKLVRR